MALLPKLHIQVLRTASTLRLEAHLAGGKPKPKPKAAKTAKAAKAAAPVDADVAASLQHLAQAGAIALQQLDKGEGPATWRDVKSVASFYYNSGPSRIPLCAGVRS